MATQGFVGTALWLTATVASTAIVWTASSTVADDVTDRPAAAIARNEVVSQLESGSVEAQPTTTARPAAPNSPPTTARSPELAPPGPVASPQPESPPASPSAAPPAPSTTVAVRATTTTTRPAAEPAVRQTATYSTSGGIVRVACEGFFFIQLISATPANGYSAIVVSRGPANVEVHFVRFGQDHSVKAICLGQPIRYYDEDSEFSPSRTP